MKRGAFSLVELLVVLAIICVVIALSLPAVQYARESGRRTQCVSNIRQLALALHQYEAAHRALPHFAQNNYSFHVTLLPFLEQKALHQKFDYSLNAMTYRGPLLYQRLSVFECPTDASCSRVPQFPAVTNYHGNWGTGNFRYGNNGIFSYHDDKPGFVRYLPFSAITDGLSETAMLAEVLASDNSSHALRTFWSVPRSDDFANFADACQKAPGTSPPLKTQKMPRGRPWLEGGMNWTIYNHILTPNQGSCSYGRSVASGAFTSSSFHGAFVNLAMADGSIRGVSDSVDITAWRALGSRAGDP